LAPFAVAVKLVLVPSLIAAITLVGVRLGPRVAGALTGLPVVAGPIVLFLALEQGPAFAAQSARATLGGEGALGVFCVVYAASALRASWWTSLALGWAAFIAATFVLERVDPGLAAAAAIALATPAAIAALTPRPELPAARGEVPRAEIALRMGAGAVLVVAITGLSRALGPRWSGLLTVFPVVTAILAVFSHRNQGAPFAVYLLRGLAAGIYSLTAFFLTLALGLDRVGVGAAFAGAVLASLMVQSVVLARFRRAQRRPGAG